ncbi:MAG: hypothetical protein ACK5MV_06105 [Aminipila sp.]
MVPMRHNKSLINCRYHSALSKLYLADKQIMNQDAEALDYYYSEVPCNLSEEKQGQVWDGYDD